MKKLKKYTIGIEPNDTLFFRSGTPFSIGEETWAETSVLPNPSVLWGALFSTMLINKHITLEDKSKLIINGIFLQRKEMDKISSKILIPAPLDVYKDNERGICKKKYIKRETVISNYSTSLPYVGKPNTDKKIEDVSNYFIDWIDFIETYPNENLSVRIYSSEYFNANIYKVGIARSNDTRTSEEGKLYRMDMNEYKSDWEIIVEFEAPNFTDTGILKLGGEGKTAKYRIIPNSVNKPQIKDEANGFFKVYFHTPAFFESGNGLLELSNLKNAKLISASVGRPISIGGFDMEKGKPKPMRKAIPPGTVYLFKGNPLDTNVEIKSLFSVEDQKIGFCIYHLIN